MTGRLYQIQGQHGKIRAAASAVLPYAGSQDDLPPLEMCRIKFSASSGQQAGVTRRPRRQGRLTLL